MRIFSLGQWAGLTAVLVGVLAGSGLPAADTSAAASKETRWERRAREKQALARGITWLDHEPPVFLYRRGGHFDDEPERYERMCDPGNLRRMAAAGVRFGRIFFYKGFGLEYERAHIETAKRVADEMHRLGMKVGLYFAGTMFTETLYREVPEARDWEQRDQNDQWVPYGIQTFRHYACPNEPAYREYLKRILKLGVEELRADEIAFDNIMLQPEPKSCRCPRCQKAFREFLRAKYPDHAVVRRRFGLPDVDWIRVNEWESAAQPESLSSVDDPVLQEWTRFRCESLARHARALNDYVKSLNPNVATLFNIKGVYSYNRYWANAVYHPLYAGHVDIVAFDTGGYDARLDAGTGALVSQIRSFKMARRLGASCEESLRDELRAAVHMAFGYETSVAGYVGAPWFNGAHSVFTPILEFLREHHGRFYTRTELVADVAVIRNWPSMAYSINDAYVPATLAEQVLIQHRIPFDLLFEEQLDRLDRYPAVLLAGQECVGDAQARRLLDYVRQGGSLVVAGNTGDYNDWRERRRVNPFLPARREGKGRILVIPQILPAEAFAKKGGVEDQNPEPGAALRKAARMSPPQWVLPKNHEEIHQTILEALPGGASLVAEAPLTTVAELVTRAETRETIAHFVNFDREHPLAPFRVTVRKQFPGRVKSVLCFSPEHDDSAPVPFQEEADRVAFTVPGTSLYAMLVIAQ
jgi:hypothetical protein